MTTAKIRRLTAGPAVVRLLARPYLERTGVEHRFIRRSGHLGPRQCGRPEPGHPRKGVPREGLRFTNPDTSRPRRTRGLNQSNRKVG
jgi:hypothetical protein